MKIVICEDFSDAPGARYRTDGPKSGQEFFEDVLDEAFRVSLGKDELLEIDMDGTWGYASSFLSEAFGLLANKYGPDEVLRVVRVISGEDPSLIDVVRKEIKRPYEKNN
jgi:hypothetical protein